MLKFAIYAVMHVLLCFLAPSVSFAKTRLACSDAFQLAASASTQELAIVRAQTESFNIDCGQGLVRGIVLAAGTPMAIVGYVDHLDVKYALVETPGRVLVAVRSADLSPRSQTDVEVFAWDTDGVSLCPERTDCGTLHDSLIDVSANAFGRVPGLWQRVSPDAPMAQCGRLAAERSPLCLAPLDDTPGASVATALSGTAVQVVPPPGPQTQIPKPLWRTMPIRNIEDLGAMVANTGLSPKLGGFDRLNSINTKDCGVPYSAAGLYFAGINQGLQKIHVAEDWMGAGSSMQMVAETPANGEEGVIAGRVKPQSKTASAVQKQTKSGSTPKRHLYEEAFFASTGDSGKTALSRREPEPHQSMMGSFDDRDPDSAAAEWAEALGDPDLTINPEAMQHFFAVLLFQTLDGAATPMSLAPVTVDVVCRDGRPLHAKAVTINLPAVGQPLVMNDEKVLFRHAQNIESYVYDAEYFQVYGLYGGYSMDVKNRHEFFLWQTVLQDVWEQDERVRNAFPEAGLRRAVAAGLRDISMAMTVRFSPALVEQDIDKIILFEDLLSEEDF